MSIAHRDRRHPHQVLIAGMCIVTGLPVLLAGISPNSLVATLPALLVYSWGVTLVVGGAVIVAAAAVRDDLTGLYLELVADVPVALTMLTYAGAVIAVAGWGGVSTIALFGGAGIAFFIRAWQVYRAVGKLRRALIERRSP